MSNQGQKIGGGGGSSEIWMIILFLLHTSVDILNMFLKYWPVIIVFILSVSYKGLAEASNKGFFKKAA